MSMTDWAKRERERFEAEVDEIARRRSDVIYARADPDGSLRARYHAEVARAKAELFAAIEQNEIIDERKEPSA